MPCVHVTDSGIQVKVWMTRVLAVHLAMGQTTGPMFIDAQGLQSTTADMNTLFLECLSELLETKPGLFGLDVSTNEELIDKYHVYRSFRRGSESRAVAMKVSEADRYVVEKEGDRRSQPSEPSNRPTLCRCTLLGISLFSSIH